MLAYPLDRQLHRRLMEIPEIAASGFSAREGLTGAGVTIIKGSTYFGSWRVTAGSLVWVSASMSDTKIVASSLDDAVRKTLVFILRSLQDTHVIRVGQAMAG
jgi:hypothetical protein